MTTSSTATSAATSQGTTMTPVWYRLVADDQQHTLIAEGKAKHHIDDVEDLRQAVYNANDTSLPTNCRHTHLHVYPPNTTDFTQPAASPKRKISELLQQSDDTIVVVARPPQQQQLHRLEDAALMSFLDVLLRTDVSPNEQRILDFGSSHMFGKPAKQTRMLVRECYEELYDVIVNSRTCRSLLIGTPGIGKSLFGIYMVKRLIQQTQPHQTAAHSPAARQRSVVWISGRMNRCAIFSMKSTGDRTIELMESDIGQHHVERTGIFEYVRQLGHL
jgi:hypothetical protein